MARYGVSARAGKHKLVILIPAVRDRLQWVESRPFQNHSRKRLSHPWSAPAGCSAPIGIDVQPDRNPHLTMSTKELTLVAPPHGRRCALLQPRRDPIRAAQLAPTRDSYTHQFAIAQAVSLTAQGGLLRRRCIGHACRWLRHTPARRGTRK